MGYTNPSAELTIATHTLSQTHKQTLNINKNRDLLMTPPLQKIDQS